MANTKHVNITVTETATITRDVEVTEEELQKIQENDSPILDEIFCELDYAKDADREFNYSVDLNEELESSNIRTATEINPNWSEYDQTVASCHLANYGIIFLDEYDYPIDNEYRLEDLNNEYVNQKCKSQLHQSPKTSVWAVMREILHHHAPIRTRRRGDDHRDAGRVRADGAAAGVRITAGKQKGPLGISPGRVSLCLAARFGPF